MKIVSIGKGNINDIPEVAKKFAEECATKEVGRAKRIALVIEHEDGKISFRAWGAYEPYAAIGLLEVGKDTILQQRRPKGSA